jgi:lipopolysaccharide/colanic/teichoic acid biosynthesis glycosyltransferase
MQKLDSRQDPRIIPFGHFLRASGLDELPQLWNVVRGEMSLIGPRPCIEYEREGFHTWQHSRFNTIPGLTGLWQVNGKNRTTFSQMMRMDVSYSRKKSFGGDLLIIVKTIPAVFSQLLDQYILKKPKTKTQPTGTPATPSPATETHPGSAHPLEQN